MVEAQGGDPVVVDAPWKVLPAAPVKLEASLDSAKGYLAQVDAEALGRAAVALGAGRIEKGDQVDPAVGIEFYPKIGDRLDAGSLVATVHARDREAARVAADRVLAAIIVSDAPVDPPPLIVGWHGTDGAR